MSRAAVASAPVLPIPVSLEPVIESGMVAEADQSAADRRAHTRHALDAMPVSCKARLKFGPAVTLVDISNGGAQIQTTNYRIQPGSAVVLELTSEQGDLAIPATVLRCQLASLLPEPIYRGALVFKRDFDVRSLGWDAPESDQALERDVTAARTRLRQIIERLAIGEGAGAPAETTIAPLLGALTAAHATLETPAGRRVAAELEGTLATLFQYVATTLQQTPTPAALQKGLEEHLHRMVAARAIAVADAHGPTHAASAEAILLTLPRLTPDAPPARLTVEFAEGAEPSELHFHILKAGIQLVAMARELGRLNGMDRPLLVLGAEPLPEGWSRIVACAMSGRTQEGFTSDFTPAGGQLELHAEPTPASTAAVVPFTELKMIRFLKDPARRTAPAGAVTATAAPKGRKLRITFTDGQQLEGTTESYRRSAPGFFVQPSDPEGDDERVFVMGSATTQVIFG